MHRCGFFEWVSSYYHYEKRYAKGKHDDWFSHKGLLVVDLGRVAEEGTYIVVLVSVLLF